MLDCPTGGPGCVPDTARHQRWPGPGLGYIQKFIMHYEVLLLIAALPSPAPTTTVTGWAARGAARQVAGQGGGRVRVGEEGSGKGVGALLSSPPAVRLPTRPSAWVASAWARPLRRVPARPPPERGGRPPRPHGTHPRRLPPANRARGRAPVQVRRRCGRDAGAAERASGWPVLPRAPGPARGLPVEGRRGAPGDDPRAAAWALPLCSRAGARTHGRTCAGRRGGGARRG